jgi:hypothetical protein
MRTFFCVMTILVFGGGSSLAQVSTLGTTQMAIPTTPGAIVSSPLSGPGPFTSLFSPATVSGAPATTLAASPLAQDPTIPGTSVNCSAPTFTLSPSVMSVTSSSAGASSSPMSSSMSPMSTTTMPASPTAPTTALTTRPLVLPPAAPVMILGSITGSTTGTVAGTGVLGNPVSGTSCTAAPGNALTSATVMPLTTPDIPASPPPGTIQSPTASLAGTSIEPAMTVMPTPNSAACNESVSMDLANPAMMAPANATGAAATPGVAPPTGC